ncbi:MAG: hypothetical protein ACRYG8_05135 [Janthinobacterium lividum]
MGRKATIKRGAEPARRVFGPALFDAIPKAVFGRVAYQLARFGADGDDVGDQTAKRRLLALWDDLAPEGLPLPSPEERTALAPGQGATTWATSTEIREDLFVTPAEAAEKHRQLTAAGSYLMWFINAPDLAHDGHVVAWAKIADPQGGVRLAGELIGDSLEAVRAMLPLGLERLERTPLMPEGVVEAWDQPGSGVSIIASTYARDA